MNVLINSEARAVDNSQPSTSNTKTNDNHSVLSLRSGHLQMGAPPPGREPCSTPLPQRRLQPLRRPQQLLLQPLHLLGNLLQLLLRHQPSRRHLMRLPIRFPHRRTNPHRHPRQPILPSHHSLPKTTPPSYTPTTPSPSQPFAFWSAGDSGSPSFP